MALYGVYCSKNRRPPPPHSEESPDPYFDALSVGPQGHLHILYLWHEKKKSIILRNRLKIKKTIRNTIHVQVNKNSHR